MNKKTDEELEAIFGKLEEGDNDKDTETTSLKKIAFMKIVRAIESPLLAEVERLKKENEEFKISEDFLVEQIEKAANQHLSNLNKIANLTNALSTVEKEKAELIERVRGLPIKNAGMYESSEKVVLQSNIKKVLGDK